MVGVLALAACAVLAGATSLLAVGEWITDAPPHVLEHVGMRLDPLFPERSLPAETTVRRLLARIDGDALDLAVGRWLADRRNRTRGAASTSGAAPRNHAEDHWRAGCLESGHARFGRGPQEKDQLTSWHLASRPTSRRSSAGNSSPFHGQRSRYRAA
ncbi:transposase family protein [Streptomyces sp. NPDC005122]